MRQSGSIALRLADKRALHGARDGIVRCKQEIALGEQQREGRTYE